MGRSILGVVAGYICMFVVVFVALTGAYLAMGADKAFKPASYDPSTLWIAVMAVVGLVAAIVGGIVCKVIARKPKAITALAILVVVLGALSAIPAFLAEPSEEERTGDVSNLDAMAKAQTPVWVAILNPIIGVVGVVIGGRLVGRSGKPQLPAA